MPRTPNPMYIFSSWERRFLMAVYQRASSAVLPTTKFGTVNFSFARSWNPKLLEEDTALVEALPKTAQAPTEKLILEASFSAMLNIPHHIHKDGRREDQADRSGPIRTYFDGSHIASLGHAVMIEIDHNVKTVTTQCPRGYNFPEQGEKILHGIYPTYERVTLRLNQQKDSHSCAALTLHNIFARAGLHDFQEEIDVKSWRSELLGALERYETHYNVKEPPFLTPSEKREVFGSCNPVFHQRYV